MYLRLDAREGSNSTNPTRDQESGNLLREKIFRQMLYYGQIPQAGAGRRATVDLHPFEPAKTQWETLLRW